MLLPPVESEPSGGGGGGGGRAPLMGVREKLVQDRAHWQKRMTDVLDGRLSLEDVEGVVAECLSKGEDLAQQLVVLQTPTNG